MEYVIEITGVLVLECLPPGIRRGTKHSAHAGTRNLATKVKGMAAAGAPRPVEELDGISLIACERLCLLHGRLYILRSPMPPQQLWQVLRKRGPRQHHVATHFVRLLL